jgi:hypothetical protein
LQLILSGENSWTGVNRANIQQKSEAPSHDEAERFREVMNGLSTEVSRVLIGEAGPLFGQIVGGEDGRNRADRNTCAAIDTLYGIDEQLLCIRKAGFVFLGVDAVHRTGVDASHILCADAGFRNYVCHLIDPFLRVN